MKTGDDMIFENRAHVIALVVFESRSKGRVWNFRKGCVAGRKYGHFILKGKIGIYVSILFGQKGCEFRQIRLIVEQVSEIQRFILSEGNGSQRSKADSNECEEHFVQWNC